MRKERFIKIVTILTIIASIITLVSSVFSYLIPLYLAHKFNIVTSKSNTIGIIGGADGPTSIYVSSSHAHPGSVTVIFALLTISALYI